MTALILTERLQAVRNENGDQFIADQFCIK